MAFFKLPLQQRPYNTSIGGTRAFVSGNSGLERVVLELGKTATLEIAGIAGVSAKPVIQQVPANSVSDLVGLLNPGKAKGPDVVTLSKLSGGGTTRTFTITGIAVGTAALLVDGQNPLFVVVGSFTNHAGMEHDLIANAFKSSSNLSKMHVLTRMLFNNDDNLFNENSDYNEGKWGILACGTVSKVGGAAVFFDKLDYTDNTYYSPPLRGNTRDDIKYDMARLQKGLDAIKARLAKGIPSIVGMVYDPEDAIKQGYIHPTKKGGHTVPIVGCSPDGRQFLYIDVYPNGSKLTYTGGHFGLNLFPNECGYLGIFQVTNDAVRKIDILRGTPATGDFFSGSSFLEVVTGPVSG